MTADETALAEDAPPPDRGGDWRRQPLAWIAVGLACLLLILGAVTLSQWGAPRPDAAAQKPLKGTPPLPEPLVFAPIAASEARELNDAQPFAKDRGPASRPFAFAGAADSRERAVDCLASAMWYEAGGDARGQRAVAQVVLNRVRHPAYPGTVCGVVFQGSERRTGCQFTFTCDGALRRIPPAGSWALTRERARAMLEGSVAPEVGLATHYHTDWVHPIWSARLEKIAQVDTHLFFRWSGVWGSAAAMRKGYGGDEPLVPGLAFLSPFHSADPAAVATLPSADALLLPPGVPPPLRKPEDLGGGKFRVFMSPARNGNVQAVLALEYCGTREYCKLTGVLDQPGAIVAPPVVFVYLRNRATGFERAMWDCERFRRPTTTQCFGAQRDITEPVAPEPSPSPSESAAPKGNPPAAN